LNEEENQVGLILVGKSLKTLVQQIREKVLAQITIYDLEGKPFASTLLQSENILLSANLLQGVLSKQDRESPIRPLAIASTDYSEILKPWEARGGEDLGITGISLAQSVFPLPTPITGFQALIGAALVFLAIIFLGITLANQITRPLSRVVWAFTQVAKGNFEVKVLPEGNDEVAVMASAFNYMVAGLQEGTIYRELLGRTVAPEVREIFRQSFENGKLQLEGQNTVATVLMSDVRNFTRMAEKEEPTTILNWLNEYFGQLVPVVTSHGGIWDKFEGDAMLAHFGILPTPLTPQESAYHACQAALDMLAVVNQINANREKRGEPPLITGIGVNTGTLTAGGLGIADQVSYTIIGDTVNTTQRIQDLSREFGESGVIISESTLTALQEQRCEFQFAPLGERAIKGKQETVWLYRLLPMNNLVGK
jgi:adenylate cyclase